MKRLIIVLLVITSLSVAAQESVLLRVNYRLGDKYLIKVESKQNMGSQGVINMNTTMDMMITEVEGGKIKTESKITSIVMDMMQGGMPMSYDSNKKDEELDQLGKMMKSQFDPMMKATIHTSLDNLGNMIEINIEPSIPGMDQYTRSSSNINYPEEKVSVGSTWTSENEIQGMKMSTTYTVSNIANGIVYLEILGDLTGVGTGTIKGKTEVDISSGVQKNAEVEVTISSQGINVSIISKTTITKI